MSTLFPDHSANQRLLKLQLYAMGATEDTLVDCMNDLNRAFNERLAMSGGQIQILGVRTFVDILPIGVNRLSVVCRTSLNVMTARTFGIF
jgi:hypothetical protein